MNDHPVNDHPVNDHPVNDHPVNDHPVNDHPAPLNSPAKIREVLHELRAPLGGIRAMVQMLAASGLDPHQARIVQALEASAAHLCAVANGVLGAEAQAEAAPQALGTFLDALLLPARLRAEALGMRISLQLDDPTLAGLAMGSSDLRQVLENLIDNALRLARGKVTLVVARRDEGRIQFALFDQGPGLTRQEADHLIREGGRIEGRPGGAGIGLSICGRIVSGRGGRLEGGPAEAGTGEGGRGACFTFDWPDHEGGAAPTGRACLVVDDHPASRLVMRTILIAAGYQVFEAADPKAALALFERHRPGLVLSDLNMPEGGGRELLLRLAALAPDLRPRLIIVSADEIGADDPLHGVIDAQVRKPVSVDGVLAAAAGARSRAA